jgi:hypothetical protein
MDPATFGLATATPPPRRVYQRGATSLQWTAQDLNGDRMVYDVLYRQVADAVFKPLRQDMTDNFISIDGQSLADGRYVFKVVARDSPSNPAGLALTGERTTEPVDIDNTAPVVTGAGQPAISGGRARIVFEATEAASYLSRAEYSVNGGQWQTIYAEDGISDGQRERYIVETALAEPGEYAVTLRVFDANGNAGNARVIVKRQ